MTEQNWKEESGMGTGTRTDRLGDGDDAEKVGGGSILREALKGDMIVEKNEYEGDDDDDEGLDVGRMAEADIEKVKDEQRKGFGEVY